MRKTKYRIIKSLNKEIENFFWETRYMLIMVFIIILFYNII